MPADTYTSISCSGNRIEIKGDISKASDFNRFKEALSPLIDAGEKQLEVVFDETRLLTSSTVSYLLRLTKEGVSIALDVNRRELANTLSQLKVDQQLNVRERF